MRTVSTSKPDLDGAVVWTTPRLKLRTFQTSDLEAFAGINADLEVMRFLGGQALTRERSDDIAIGAQHSFAVSGIGKIAVERAADSVFLGTCGLSIEPWYPDDLEIGWRLDRRFWGHGYAREAASAWLDYAFDYLKAERVISVTDVSNARSVAVMQAIGMHLDHHAQLNADGDDFSAVIYSLSAAQWRSDHGK